MTPPAFGPLRPLLAAILTAALAVLLAATPVHATSSTGSAATMPTSSRLLIDDGGTIDTADRNQVLDAFTSRWIPAMSTPLAWTGDVATCQPGTLAPAVLDASLSATNYLRDMAGVPPVTADAAKHAAAQQAALMMDANNTLNHYPPTTWRCFTTDGATAASKSNLAIGSPGVRALAAYMADTGLNNAYAGHRKWILNPSTRTVGFGGTTRTQAMHVVNEIVYSGEQEPDYAIAWPTAGFFPEGLYPKGTYYAPSGPLSAPGAGRWSYTTYDGTVFNDATVTVTQTAPAVRSLPVTIESASLGHIVFTPTAPTLPSAINNTDVTYQITISGIRDINDVPLADVSYTTTVIASPAVPGDPNLPDDDDSDPDDDADDATPNAGGKATIKGDTGGTARPGTRLRASLTGFRATPSRLTYQWLRNGHPIKKATRATYRVTRADARTKIRVKIAIRRPRALAGTYRSESVTIRRR